MKWNMIWRYFVKVRFVTKKNSSDTSFHCTQEFNTAPLGNNPLWSFFTFFALVQRAEEQDCVLREFSYCIFLLSKRKQHPRIKH